MPDGMRDRITELAKGNNRSMNAGIVSMLQEALERRAETARISLTSGLDVDALAESLATKLVEKMKKAS